MFARLINPAYELQNGQKIAEALDYTVKSSMHNFLELASDQSRSLVDFTEKCLAYEQTKFISETYENYYYSLKNSFVIRTFA